MSKSPPRGKMIGEKPIDTPLLTQGSCLQCFQLLTKCSIFFVLGLFLNDQNQLALKLRIGIEIVRLPIQSQIRQSWQHCKRSCCKQATPQKFNHILKSA